MAVRAHDGTSLGPDRHALMAVLKVGLVAALVGVAFLAVQLAGGSSTPVNHVGYVPILVAAYLFGWRGGLLIGLLVALVLGPLLAWLGPPAGVEGMEAWLFRALGFVGVGAIVGILFDRMREAKESWRRSALTVIDREREGMTALARGVAAKDGHTGDHVVRVQRLSEDLALAVGFSQPVARDIGWSAMLHDLGKLHVPDPILIKPGPLTSAEWEIIRQHSLWGEEILANGDGFDMARRICRWHHENFDGTGYPDRLRHAAIPLEARLVRVTDAFDAMTHHRPYHDARSLEWALDELDRFAGRHFDPDIVRTFHELASARLLDGVHVPAESSYTSRVA